LTRDSSRSAEELAELALAQGSEVAEPFTGVNGFGGSLVVAGPTLDHYKGMLDAQETTVKAEARSASFAERYFAESGRTLTATIRKALTAFPIELPFDDAGGTNPRNNSAAITSLLVDGKHLLFPSDTGVQAFGQGLDHLDAMGRTAYPLKLFALPHHGSRHNLDRDTINRVLGAPGSSGVAVASVSSKALRNPSPRIANAAGRRGYPVYRTAGDALTYGEGAPDRGWASAVPLPPLEEDDHDD
jgi:hypothetical protein